MKTYSRICKGACGRPFVTKKPSKTFCCWECRSPLGNWTQAQIRFHILRAGGSAAFRKLIGISSHTLWRARELLDVDRIHLFQMVNIGGILAKRCPGCEVTWPLEKYWTNNANISGVTGYCEHCRITKRLVESDTEMTY